MKKIIYSLVLLILGSFVLSCSDDSLDPLQTDKVKKGTILALRGTQLNNIYFDGLPGAEFYPRVISGDETFDFDAEFLSEDPTTLESFDIYVINAETDERVKIRNVPFSEFKETDDYTRPWVSVSIKLTDMFDALGIGDFTDPAVVDLLLTTYQPGIDIEIDLNLTDGSQIPAAEILASGLFDSDQFYPAQKLTYNSVEFCPFDAPSWDGADFKTFDIYAEDGSVSDFYTVTLEQDNATTFTIHNFANSDGDATIVFEDATATVYEQNIELQEFNLDGTTVVGTGTYDQCNQTFSIDVWDASDDDEEIIVTYQFELD